MYNQGLFKDWVPKPAMLLLIILYLFPLLVVGGIYTPNFSNMMSDLALYSNISRLRTMLPLLEWVQPYRICCVLKCALGVKS